MIKQERRITGYYSKVIDMMIRIWEILVTKLENTIEKTTKYT